MICLHDVHYYVKTGIGLGLGLASHLEGEGDEREKENEKDAQRDLKGNQSKASMSTEESPEKDKEKLGPESDSIGEQVTTITETEVVAAATAAELAALQAEHEISVRGSSSRSHIIICFITHTDFILNLY